MKNFKWPVRVYYEDTDAGGVVYYANYLKFFERARTERLRAMGFEQDVLRQREGVIFAVRSVQVEYRRPARFNEELSVSANVSRLRQASLLFEQEIFRLDGEAELLCSATVLIACIDEQEMRPRQIPDQLFQRIKNDN